MLGLQYCASFFSGLHDHSGKEWYAHGTVYTTQQGRTITVVRPYHDYLHLWGKGLTPSPNRPLGLKQKSYDSGAHRRVILDRRMANALVDHSGRNPW